jgi:glutamate-ammonia-ligase adenylyltransferase
MLSVFDKSESKLPSTEELTKRFRAAIAACPVPVAPEQAWPAIRLVYRRELLRLAAFDVSHAHQQEAFTQVAAHLSDLAGAALDAGLVVARRELAEGQEHGVFSEAELADTSLAVIAMGKCGARELNYISDVDVIYVAESTNERTESTPRGQVGRFGSHPRFAHCVLPAMGRELGVSSAAKGASGSWRSSFGRSLCRGVRANGLG